MKILHVASFNGNIGDNAHHNGFRHQFRLAFGVDCEWVELEIREFYRSWGVRKFDDEFAGYANQFDMVVIGGGNFFEICHDYSKTGCTIDIGPDVLDKIKTPVFFNALGFDVHKGATKENLSKFKLFMDDVLSRDNCFVTFRNDGSKENYTKAYGRLDSGIVEIPDGGFFVDVPNPVSACARKIVSVNLACDMLDKRLVNKSYDTFCDELAEAYAFVIREHDALIRFYPHIVTDYKIVTDVLSRLSDMAIKYNVEVMPYVTGQGAELEYFSKYKESSVVTGMRFHTNVCSFGMGLPTCPIVTYPKLQDLYNGLNCAELLVYGDSEEFLEDYKFKLSSSLQGNVASNTDTLIRLKNLERQVLSQVNDWYVSCG